MNVNPNPARYFVIGVANGDQVKYAVMDRVSGQRAAACWDSADDAEAAACSVNLEDPADYEGHDYEGLGYGRESSLAGNAYGY